MRDGDTGAQQAPPLRPFRTIRFAVRECWDALGLLCASSLTLFIGTAVTVLIGFGSIPLGFASACLLLAPLFAGTCLLAHRTLAHDEPNYLQLWEGFRRLYWRAAGTAAVQMIIFSVLFANLAFYSGRSGFGFLLASILVWYFLGFWLMNCLYHFPLLAAAEEGLIRREDGEGARLRMVFRNGFLLAFTAPWYSLMILLFLVLVLIPLAISAVGMALVGAALPAFVGARAARDQFIRHALIPPDPDPDEPAVDEVWKVGG